MRRFAPTAVLVCLFLLFSSFAFAAETLNVTPENVGSAASLEAFAPDRILVKFTPEAFNRAEFRDAVSKNAGTDSPWTGLATFDAALNTEALEDALTEPAGELLARLLDQRWSTVLIATEGDELVIAGGAEQGLRVGDRLSVRRRGREVQDPQIEGALELPSTEVARIEITSCFGSGTNREGSTCRVIEGQLEGLDFDGLVVEQLR